MEISKKELVEKFWVCEADLGAVCGTIVLSHNTALILWGDDVELCYLCDKGCYCLNFNTWIGECRWFFSKWVEDGVVKALASWDDRSRTASTREWIILYELWYISKAIGLQRHGLQRR